MATDFVTIKVTQNTRTMLRLLAANSDKDIYEVAEAIAWSEMKRKRIAPSEVLKKAMARFEVKINGR
jgi:hypothetical protein